MEEYKYCAFIDVLGYGALVKDSSLTVAERIKMLNSIYVNLATQFLHVINDINKENKSQIYIRSFSDCFYLDCDSAEPLLMAVAEIYKNTFGFYVNFAEDEERTPLLRCGIVKDWMAKFRDIGAITNNTSELNPVGLAVARAYEVSEKSGLSGMRIIISPEVLEDLGVLHLTIPDFKCHILDIRLYSVMLRYYFKFIDINEDQYPVSLWELLWPATQMDGHAYEYIGILRKIKPTFPGKVFRHFKQTVGVCMDSLKLSSAKSRNKQIYNRDMAELAELAIQVSDV